MDEYINFDIEVITFLSAINPLIAEWKQETSTKNEALDKSRQLQMNLDVHKRV